MHKRCILKLISILTIVYAMQRSFLRRKYSTMFTQSLGQKFYHCSTTALCIEKSNINGFGSPKFYSDSTMRYVLDRQAHSGLPDRTMPFTVLGIESSCDDTGVAIVRSDGTILSQVVYSQNAIHEKFGGIVPTLAMEQHKLNIDVAVAEALEKAGMKSAEEVDVIAVTKGPGLEICLRVGLRKAQALATEYQKPFVTVHHLEAHCMLARLAGQVPRMQSISADTSSSGKPSTSDRSSGDFTTNNLKATSDNTSTVEECVTAEPELPHFTPKVAFPFLVLLASGGHTSLLLCTDIGEYVVLGGTLDDALGEAFDKAARLLGLRGASSGGVAIEQAAARYKANCTAIANASANANTVANANAKNASSGSDDNMNMSGGADANVGDNNGTGAGKNTHGGTVEKEETTLKRSGLNVPMRNKPNCDFSYAGLKTSFRRAVERAREAQGYGASNLTASNAPVKEMTESPSPVTLSEDVTGRLCADFQDTAFMHVEDRLKRALDYVDYQRIPVSALVVVGGVAANGELRRRLWALLQLRSEKRKLALQSQTTSSSADDASSEDGACVSNSAIATSTTTSDTASADIALVFPPPSLCTDNGVMVAWTAVEKICRGYSDAVEQHDVVPRWPMGNPLSAQDKEVMHNLKKLMHTSTSGGADATMTNNGSGGDGSLSRSKNERRSERKRESAAVDKLLSENTLL